MHRKLILNLASSYSEVSGGWIEKAELMELEKSYPLNAFLVVQFISFVATTQGMPIERGLLVHLMGTILYILITYLYVRRHAYVVAICMYMLGMHACMLGMLYACMLGMLHACMLGMHTYLQYTCTLVVRACVISARACFSASARVYASTCREFLIIKYLNSHGRSWARTTFYHYSLYFDFPKDCFCFVAIVWNSVHCMDAQISLSGGVTMYLVCDEIHWVQVYQQSKCR